MTTLSIRTAQPEDLDRITEIYRDAVLHGTATYELEPPSRQEMGARFEALREYGYPNLVAVEGGVILGYAYAGPFRARPAYRFTVEDSIYLAPEAQGRGIGRALLQRLIEDVRLLGFRQLVAVIGDGRPDSASVKLHQALGFQYAGVLHASGYKHGRWLDTVFMEMAMNGGSTTAPDPASLPEASYRKATQAG